MAHGTAPSTLSGVYSDPTAIARALDDAEANYHLLGSVTFGAIPPGFGVAFTVVKVDPNDQSQLYDVGLGKFGLSAVTLRKLAAAAGISTVGTRVLVNAPNYYSCEVTVQMQGLDGTMRVSSKDKFLDLREGSPLIDALQRKASSKNKTADLQIAEMRAQIDGHCQTKAWCRAVRELLGVRTYTKPEIAAKAFAVAKLQVTGIGADPETRRMLTMMIASQSLGLSGMLYGKGAQLAQLPPSEVVVESPALPPPQAAPPPPVNREPAPPARSAAPPTASPAAAQGNTRGQAPTAPPSDGQRPVFMPGKGKGLVRDASDEDLTYWIGNMQSTKDAGKWKPEYVEANQRQLDAMIAEQARRAESAVAGQDDGGGAPGVDDDDMY